MLNSRRRLTLLGPQHQYQSLRDALERARVHSAVAVVTAGWEEEEAEDQDLLKALPAGSINLRLFKRTESLFADDPEIIQQLQKRQDELRHLRDVYRMRLEAAMRSAKQVLAFRSDLVQLDAECELSIDFVRQLDQQYFARTAAVCHDYARQLDFDNRKSVLAHRRELASTMENVEALVISGGHAAIILNRLDIFALLQIRPELPLIAWSGGAMALSEQIVFYFDDLPQSDSHPELLRAGKAVFGSILPLPDARRRLRLSDAEHMALMARRFNRHECVLLENDTWIDRVQGRWYASPNANKLSATGQVERFQP